MKTKVKDSMELHLKALSLLVTTIFLGIITKSEAQQTGTFSVIPSTGKGSLVGVSPATGSINPNFGNNSKPMIPPDSNTGVFGKAPTNQGTNSIIPGSRSPSLPNNQSAGAPANTGGAGAAAPLPLGMVAQVKELVGRNGIATQSTLKGASNLTAAAASVGK